MSRLLSWLEGHKLDVALLSVIVAVSGFVSFVNMTSYPQRFEDEGTYVSQAWALKEKGQLAHYTYWYDHPPVGWIQIAGYLTVTDAFDRYDSAITAGREFMLVLHIITLILIFALARRLGMGTIAASAGTLLFGLSPLSVEFSRYVLLDNVALPWVLASFLFALSPRRNLSMAILSAVSFAIGVLSKETFAALLPVLVYALWTNSDTRNRRFTMTSFAVVFFLVMALYPLYAILKGELIPGEGHVSLLGTTIWQIFGREGSGSILEAGSNSQGLVKYWLNIDYWLLLAGAVSLPVAFFYKNLRIIAFSLLIGLALLLRTGYLPYPFVIMLLPFAALMFAGAVHAAVQNVQLRSFMRLCMAEAFFIVTGAVVVFQVFPSWQSQTQTSNSVDLDYSSRQAVSWVAENIETDSRIVVESALWSDLQFKGFEQPEPVWLYKTETDPAIVEEIGGWEGIDYVVLNGPTIGSNNFATEFPTVSTAIENGVLLQEFGGDNQKVLVFGVQHSTSVVVH